MASKDPFFYCGECGEAVDRNVRTCPGCGAEFLSVKCPECGFTGKAGEFSSGCPECGFSGEDSVHKGNIKGSEMSLFHQSGKAGRSLKQDKLLPDWIYRILAVVLIGALVFLARLLFLL